MSPIEVRFRAKVAKSDGCHLWTGGAANGYGYLWAEGKVKRATHVAWFLHTGEWPAKGIFVCHACDTPLCVRFDHLFLGTHGDNMDDRDAKGRVASGERSGARLHPEAHPRGSSTVIAKLDEDGVFVLRARYMAGAGSLSILAAEVGVDTKTVHNAVRGATWAHVAMPQQAYITTDKSSWGDGPWQREVDKVVFTDEVTGLPCLIKRSEHSGSPCGYVGVTEGHPWFGKDRDDFESFPGIEISYSAFCEEGPEGITICHVPAPGEPDRVWWLGWHHGHVWDIQPAFEARELLGHGWPPIRCGDETYATFADVKAECALVAQQAQAAAVGVSALNR